MENDANCAAMAEKLSGNAVKLDDFALITIDSGVGRALFPDGRNRRGKDWRAGELGMMIPNYETVDSTRCRITCRPSCWRRSTPRNSTCRQGSSCRPPCSIVSMSRVCARSWTWWIDYLAIGIFNIVAVADPECVLLGGGICREQELLPLVNAVLTRSRSGAISTRLSSAAGTPTTPV